MKQITILFAIFFSISFANAQQSATTTKTATATMKVDSKPSTIKAPVTGSAEPKACCAGKTAGQCSHDAKTCSKEGEAKAACCQKGGTTQTCNHGTVEKSSDTKKQ